MPDTESTTVAQTHPAKGVPGPVMILGSALGCVALFFIVWATLRSVEHHLDTSRSKLVWADRANWTAPAVIPTTLVKPNAANAQYTYNKPRYRDPGLVISDPEQQAVLDGAQYALSPVFPSDAARRGVLQHTGADNFFYLQYLMGTWHRLNNQPDKADAHYQRATDLAPNLLVIQYTDTNGNPVPNLQLNRVEIGCDRVTHEGQTLDQRLVLVYPHLETDATGRVYLPVYDTTYRPVHLPQPAGYTAHYTPDEGWFKLATHTGTLHATLDRRPQPNVTGEHTTAPGNN